MALQPSGRADATVVNDIVRFQDGRAVERWMVGDEMGMMRQIGVIPAAGV